jgi:hypothetical protein
MESEETILEPIVTGHHPVYAIVYPPGMALIATGDGIRKGPRLTLHDQSKSGTQRQASLSQLLNDTNCISESGSSDNSIRTWNTTKWEQTTILLEHTNTSTEASPSTHQL